MYNPPLFEFIYIFFMAKKRVSIYSKWLVHDQLLDNSTIDIGIVNQLNRVVGFIDSAGC